LQGRSDVETEKLLLCAFLGQHPVEAASLLERLPSSEAAEVLEDIDPEAAATALRRMAAPAAVACLVSLKRERAGAIVAGVPVEIASNLLRRMEPECRQAIVETLPSRTADALGVLLLHPENTAGALMDPLIQVLPEDITVGEALSLIQRFPRELYFYVYIVDRSHLLAGVLDIRELMLAAREETLSAIMRPVVAKLSPWADLKSIMAHPGWRDFDALPVVDESGLFLGAIRNRRIRDLERDLASAHEARGGIALLLNLGELYWSGLGQVVLDVAAAVTAGREQKKADAGGS
jgi:magnesium transporter